ncbi:MAG TPA: DUF6438 domain-containing protein [Saprospiraceae bacterium]|nr:DUF6438 domain-containing protein [Saprospiraceae bacterium]HMP12798.1 DUF6438 domain-containing protein [Saprospiraceae bacterium]
MSRLLHPEKRQPVFAALLVIILLQSCTNASLNPLQANLQELDRVIEMTKGPCYGACPVFRLTVYKGGIVSYRGERYTEKKGMHVKRISKAEYKQLVSAFQRANLWQFKDVYRSNFSDNQTVTLTYYEAGDQKTIIGKETRPEALLALEARLDALASSPGWRVKAGAAQEYIIENELIVQLRSGSDAYTWVRNYRKYELNVVEQLAVGDANQWLLRYNKKTLEPEKMLSQIRDDRDVIAAEFNKKLTARN